MAKNAVDEVATMLRQQQAEIEALKAEVVAIEKNTDYWADKSSWICNNEPVAWVYLEKWMAGIAYPDECFSDEELKGTLPLYTHPAKTLTDEEIKRAIQMLEISAEYIEQTDTYGVIAYDDADCDGGCVADDCRSIAELLRKTQ